MAQKPASDRTATATCQSSLSLRQPLRRRTSEHPRPSSSLVTAQTPRSQPRLPRAAPSRPAGQLRHPVASRRGRRRLRVPRCSPLSRGATLSPASAALRPRKLTRHPRLCSLQQQLPTAPLTVVPRQRLCLQSCLQTRRLRQVLQAQQRLAASLQRGLAAAAGSRARARRQAEGQSSQPWARRTTCWQCWSCCWRSAPRCPPPLLAWCAWMQPSGTCRRRWQVCHPWKLGHS